MNLTPKKKSMIILGITSLVLSRTMFALFNDPEGPNLLIVVVMAAILYFLSFTVYSFNHSANALKKLILAIIGQIIIVILLYLILN